MLNSFIDSIRGKYERSSPACKNIIEILVLVLFPPMLVYAVAGGMFSPTALPQWDFEQQQAPYFCLQADCARNLSPMFWNPLSTGGSPDAAIPDYYLLSPFVALAGLLFGSGMCMVKATWFLIWVAAGWGMGALGRSLKAPVWGICVVNAGYLFCGVFCGQAQNPSSFAALTFLPWIIWRLDAALLKNRWLYAAQAGVIWGLSANSSYIAMSLVMTGSFCGFWWLGRTLFWSDDTLESSDSSSVSTTWSQKTVAFGIFSAVGLLAMSPVLGGLLYDIKGYSDRAGELPRDVAITENLLNPGAVISYATPYLSVVKLYVDGALLKHGQTCLTSIYVGAFPFVFALAAILFKPRDKWRWWLFGVAALFLLASFGLYTPLRGWLYDLLPPFRYFRNAALFRLYYIFLLSLLALYATRDLRFATSEHQSRYFRILFGVAMISGVGGLLGYALLKYKLRNAWESLPLRQYADLQIICIWGGVAGICAWCQRKATVNARSLLAVAAVILVCIDAKFSFVLNRPLMIFDNPGAAQYWAEVEKSNSHSLDFTANGLNRIFRSEGRAPYPYSCLHNFNLIEKKLVLDNYTPLVNTYHLATCKSDVLRQSALGSERIWFSPTAPEVPLNAANFAAFKARAEALNAAPIVRHSSAEILKPSLSSAVSPEIASLSAPVNIHADVIRYLPEQLNLKLTAPSKGWLLVTERWGRSWSVSVNGRSTELFGGNFIFRCVEVPEGPCTVDFQYKPFGEPYFMIWSIAMTAFVVLISLVDAVFSAKKTRSKS